MNVLDVPLLGDYGGMQSAVASLDDKYETARASLAAQSSVGAIYNNSSIDVYDNDGNLTFHTGPDGTSILKNLTLANGIIGNNALQNQLSVQEYTLNLGKSNGVMTNRKPSDGITGRGSFSVPSWATGCCGVVTTDSVYYRGVGTFSFFTNITATPGATGFETPHSTASPGTLWPDLGGGGGFSYSFPAGTDTLYVEYKVRCLSSTILSAYNNSDFSTTSIEGGLVVILYWCNSPVYSFEMKQA